MYFGPGIHRPDDLPNNQIRIPSNTTVYLAPGAIVQAKLLIDKSENVRILGRGILDHPIRGIEVTDSKNILIDGITVINPDHYSIFGGGSTGLVIKNFKTFSCKGWSDGIDLMCCRNVDISNVFLRNSDDCIALYNHRWNWWGGSSDITIKNAVLWADIAHPINMGGHGDPESTEGEILENVHVSYIDILEHDEDDRNYQGCMSIDCGDKNIVRHVTFDHIWVDDFQEGRLFNLHILFNPKYNKAPGGKIEDITFSHINYNGVGANPSVICGYDEEHAIKNIRFKNVTINKKRLSSLIHRRNNHTAYRHFCHTALRRNTSTQAKTDKNKTGHYHATGQDNRMDARLPPGHVYPLGTLFWSRTGRMAYGKSGHFTRKIQGTGLSTVRRPLFYG